MQEITIYSIKKSLFKVTTPEIIKTLIKKFKRVNIFCSEKDIIIVSNILWNYSSTDFISHQIEKKNIEENEKIIISSKKIYINRKVIFLSLKLFNQYKNTFNSNCFIIDIVRKNKIVLDKNLSVKEFYQVEKNKWLKRYILNKT